MINGFRLTPPVIQRCSLGIFSLLWGEGATFTGREGPLMPLSVKPKHPETPPVKASLIRIVDTFKSILLCIYIALFNKTLN